MSPQQRPRETKVTKPTYQTTPGAAE